ncbi:MAG TPA: M48 family metalloprotease [Candidatus Acidoferrales bacterium]|nr:M48 family metalloprotease [Candidatus Acidoferrales bacterium]
MRILKTVLVVLALGALPLRAADQPNNALDQVVGRIISTEQAQMNSFKPFTPLVETYIQNLRGDAALGYVPAGDKYFLGRAILDKGVELEPLTDGNDSSGPKKKIIGSLGSMFSLSMEYLPRGFLQMIYIDTNGFDREHYKFDYVRREFLGEVRTLVFDVTPQAKAGKGRFMGRIWVEDQDFHIVRFNGAYSGSSRTNYYFHFDSWRVNTGPNLWLPAFIYSEESDLNFALAKRLSFKAQTRLWGYNLGHSKQEQELSKILIESQTPVKDQTTTANDINPVMAQRTWDRQAEDNVVDKLERLGLLAPQGEVDKVLETVVNNLEVTNNLDVQPEIRCRVLMTSTLESFAIGHTIVFSRGLIDVLPDEASLATMVAHELAHVVLDHRIDGQYGFFDRLLFDEKDTFRHFGFSRTQPEEEAANAKANELLKNSPYKDQLTTAKFFLDALENRQKDIPNLISPHLGDRVPVNMTLASAAPAPHPPAGPNAAADPKPQTNQPSVVALPLGGRVKMDPYSDKLEMLKSKPVGTVAEREKMPFEVTPFILYLTRQTSTNGVAAPSATSANTKAVTADKAPLQ